VSKMWGILRAGIGDRVVVVQLGAGSFSDLGAEIMFPVVAGLEDRQRVISVG